jgi:hypothetical protein
LNAENLLPENWKTASQSFELARNYDNRDLNEQAHEYYTQAAKEFTDFASRTQIVVAENATLDTAIEEHKEAKESADKANAKRFSENIIYNRHRARSKRQLE